MVKWWHQELSAAAHTASTVRKHSETNAGAHAMFSLLFAQDPSVWAGVTHCWYESPTSANTIEKLPHSHGQRLIQLVVSSNHPRDQLVSCFKTTTTTKVHVPCKVFYGPECSGRLHHAAAPSLEGSGFLPSVYMAPLSTPWLQCHSTPALLSFRHSNQLSSC